MAQHQQESAGQSGNAQIFLGFGGLFAAAGDHIGHFYYTRDEWKDLLIPFLKTGLETGDKCVYLATQDPGWQTIQEALGAAGIDVTHALTSGQLVLDDGKATPEELRNWLTSCVVEIPDRFHLLRWGGDMTWFLRKMPTSEALMIWEESCNTLGSFPAVFLCQYDLT